MINLHSNMKTKTSWKNRLPLNRLFVNKMLHSEEDKIFYGSPEGDSEFVTSFKLEP